MKELFAAMRQQASMQAMTQATTRFGIVTSYDPVNYCAKVEIQPEGAETGWLAISSPWVGNTWGIFAPVSPGDMVQVEFQEGDALSGFIVGRFFNDEDRPLNVQSGEFWLVHQSGSALKFHNNGAVELFAAQNLTATVGGNATISVDGTITSSATSWTHTGPLTVNGPITGTQGMSITGSYSGGPTVYFTGSMHFNGVQITADAASTMTFNGKRIDDTLRVSGVQTGSGTSGTPV